MPKYHIKTVTTTRSSGVRVEVGDHEKPDWAGIVDLTIEELMDHLKGGKHKGDGEYEKGVKVARPSEKDDPTAKPPEGRFKRVFKG